MRKSSVNPEPVSDPPPSKWSTIWFWSNLGLLLAGHAVALAMLLPPSELLDSSPIYGADHPGHAHRVHVYREAKQQGDWPWGYDPAVCAGVVMRPTQDAGAKPQQILGSLLPGLKEGQIIRWFVFLSALTMPLWILLAARLMHLPREALLWILTVLLSGAWLYQNFLGFFRWGLAAFAFASFLAPLALVLFLRFVEQPGWGRYFLALLTLAAVAMLHVLGPVLLVPLYLGCALLARPLGKGWRLAAWLLGPLAILINAFWLVPFVLDLQTPKNPFREFATYPADLVYVSREHLLAMLSPQRVVAALGALTVGLFGLWSLSKYTGRRMALCFGVAAFLGVVLKFGGSFVPVVVMMQPSRFLLSAFALLVFPVGLGLHEVTRKLRLPSSLGALTAALVLISFASWSDWRARQGTGPEAARQHVNFAGQIENETPTFVGLPQPVPIPRLLDPLTEFVQHHTQPTDRLLLQTLVQCEPKILAVIWNREVVGNAYPDQHDSANFVLTSLWGRKLEDWKPDEVRDSLQRWGIQWVFTGTEPARKLFAAATGTTGITVDKYQAFRTANPANRFLVGTGEVSAQVNRLELQNLKPQDGLIVLRYRYHPAWDLADSGQVERYPVPEDAGGLLAIRNPPPSLTLRFNPIKLFSARWPSD